MGVPCAGPISSCVEVFALAARGAVVAITAGATVAAVTAVAPVATLRTLALCASWPRALLMRVDADGEVADHVFVDLGLALQFGDDRGRRVEVERDIVRLAVLLMR
jgi:hypothetical protein